MRLVSAIALSMIALSVEAALPLDSETFLDGIAVTTCITMFGLGCVCGAAAS